MGEAAVSVSYLEICLKELKGTIKNRNGTARVLTLTRTGHIPNTIQKHRRWTHPPSLTCYRDNCYAVQKMTPFGKCTGPVMKTLSPCAADVFPSQKLEICRCAEIRSLDRPLYAENCNL
jgi:hypothetical protein